MSLSKRYSYRLFLFFFCCSSLAFGQQAPKRVGTISGSVKDSVTMGALTPATIAVYTTRDTALVKYRLNDLRGRFTLDSLPTETELLVIVSYVGFRSFKSAFTLTANEPIRRLENILLSVSSTMLKEVLIAKPPMVMRGDTIEFSADAFKTQKNAVVGDLLKKLPGIIIWGDGKITVNGKRVSQVIVDGKTFFEDDPRIVTENLPKEVVDKVQVYPDAPKRTTDSASNTLTMNVTLKEGKKSGLFGKIGGGYGTNGRYDANLTVAAYTAKDQFSFAASANDVNKENLSIGDMMLNSSFKNTAITSPFFLSNFASRGVTEQKSVAALHQRDWNRRWHTRADVVNSISNNLFEENTNVTTVLGDSSLLRTNINNNTSSSRNSRIGGDLRFRDSTFNLLNVNLDYSQTRNEMSSISRYNTFSSSGISLNETENNFDQINNSENMQFNVRYEHKGGKDNRPSKEDVEMKYSFSRSHSAYDKTNNNRFFDHGGNSTVFNRLYNERYRTSTHQFNTDYRSLGRLLGSRTTRFRLNFYNEIYYQDRDMDNMVKDFDQATKSYTRKNDYLSNAGSRKLFIDRPAIGIFRQFDRTTLGRLYKALDLNALLKGEFVSQSNRTIKDFQDIDRHYSSFLPDLSVRLVRRNIKVSRVDLSFRYTRETSIPDIDQLVPLIDSSQVLNYYLGNRALQKSIRQNYQVNFYWNNEKTNGHTLNVQVNSGRTSDAFSDSTYYTPDGRRIVTPINMPYYYKNVQLDFKKPVKINKTLITLEVKGNYSNSARASYFNSNLRKVHLRSFGGNGLAGMSMNDKIGLRWDAWFKAYRVRVGTQSDISETYDYGSSLQLSLKITKKLSIGHSFNLNTTTRDYSNQVSAFIWNAFISQRLGRKDEFEFTFNANDILNNNLGLINRIDDNSLITGTVSRLRQYFLLSFAYYPRFF